MHKCDGCKYKGEHKEMGFRAIGVCLMECDLVGAVLSFNAAKCPYFKEDMPLPQKLGKLQSTISQLGKALCGKENATLDELLKAADQLKNDLQYTVDAANVMKDEALKLEQRLAQVERERDALLHDLRRADYVGCTVCKHSQNSLECDLDCKNCFDPCECNSFHHNNKWEWRGLCAQNTKDVGL